MGVLGPKKKINTIPEITGETDKGKSIRVNRKGFP
jgi:hypothetical protein